MTEKEVKAVDWRKIKERWAELQPEAQRAWPELSPEELERTEGNRSELMARLQEHYRWSAEEAGLAVDRWADGLQGERGLSAGAAPQV